MPKTFLSLTVVAAIIFSFASCSGSGSFEGKVKAYMKDSVVPKFNDPSSYEYMSISTPDTLYKHKLVQEMIDVNQEKLARAQSSLSVIGTDTVAMQEVYNRKKIELQDAQELIAKFKSQLNEPDKVISIGTTVSFRAKNAMGALVINQLKLSYYPAIEAEHIPEHFIVHRASLF